MVPELTVTDVAASLAFYEAAGFSVRFRRSDPPFAYLELGQAQLMIEQRHSRAWVVAPLVPPLGRGVNFQVEVPSADRTLSALRTIGVEPYVELAGNWYSVSTTEEEGQREFLAQDPDGYLFRFSEPLGSRRAA